MPGLPSSITRRRRLRPIQVGVAFAVALLAVVGLASAVSAQSDNLIDADFSGSADGFVFGDVNDPSGTNYVDGTLGAGQSGDGLTVTLGGVNNDNINDMAGAWSHDFTLAQAATATITLDYRVEQADPYDGNEYSEARVAVDGALVEPASGSFPRVTAGGTAGWSSYTAQVALSAGSHSLELIGFNNQKTYNDEVTIVRFDNVTVAIPVVATPTPIPTATSTPTPLPTATPTVIPTATPLPGPSCGGGALAQEAEDGTLSGTMIVVSNGAASGNEFVQAEVGTRGRTYPNTDVAEYCVTVPTAGDYRLDATVWAPNANDDSFYVTIDNGTMALWDMSKNPGFADDSVSNRGGDDPVVWTLSAGEHVVRFHQREDGAGIDKFELVSLTPQQAVCAAGSQEAEQGVLTGSMTVVADAAASGNSFVQVAVGTRGRPGPGSDYAEYCMTVPTGGDYRLDATIWAPNSADDSFYVTIDNEPHALWDMDKNPTFHTDSVSDRNGADPVIWNLTPGDHTIRFHHREDGAGLDNLTLVLVTPPTPTPIPPTATPTPIPPTPTPTPVPDGIILYEGPNQSGDPEALAPGVYSGANGFSSVQNNTASSFAITPGYIALMCTKGAATGTCRGFTNSKNLADFSLNNNVSYVQIRQIGDPFILGPRNDLTQIVNRLPAATEFVFTPGTYTGHSLIAKDNMVFTGQPGAILDGNGMNTHAISGLGDNVVIRGLEITGYEPGWMQGVISARNTANFSQEGTGWLVENNNIHHNEFIGINVASQMTVRDNDIHHNGQMGVSGIADDNNRLNGVIIDGNRIYNNATNVDGFDFTYHEGGVKFTYSSGLEIINNVFTDNYGRQSWCDVLCDGVLFDNNTFDVNVAAVRTKVNPIMFEISRNAIIRNNTMTVSVVGNKTDYGIEIAEAADVLVENNDITMTSPDGETAWGLYFRNINNREVQTANVEFRDNTVHAPSDDVQVGSSNGRGSNVTFVNNDYTGEIVFKDSGDTESWNNWRNDLDRDTSGSFTP